MATEIDALPNAQNIGWADAYLVRNAAGDIFAKGSGGGDCKFQSKQVAANNDFQVGGVLDVRTAGNGQWSSSAEFTIRWTDASGSSGGTADLALARGAAGILNLSNPASAGAAIQFTEMTAPSAGAANTARLFCRDNGSGKSQLCVIFATGAIQVVATEP